jgi:CheY-like chemotaxis protein
VETDKRRVILAVDDNGVNLCLLKGILEQPGRSDKEDIVKGFNAGDAPVPVC